MLWTPLFFTFSSSLIHPYILPSLPALAILVSHLWNYLEHKKRLICLALFVPLITLAVVTTNLLSGNLEQYYLTDKYLIEAIPTADSGLYTFKDKTYSAQFYSGGTINLIHNFEEICNDDRTGSYIILANKDLVHLSPKHISRLQHVKCSKKKCIYQIDALQ